MLGFAWKSGKRVVSSVVHAFLGAFVLAVVGLVVYLDARPDLAVWQTADLDEEFSAGKVERFADYLALEDRLFAQLQEEVYDRVPESARNHVQRYSRGSLADPARWPRDWNRSFVLERESPRAGVLLIHGMSDSPYSLRSLGERLHADGSLVIGLRVPGHGTAPSGLLDVEWEDMAAAVRLAMVALRARAGDRPLAVVGYSNGGALAVEYALAALEDAALPRAHQLVLLSPEIGITRLAGLAVWQERLGHVLGLEKLAWNSILPEYDPFKYNSFALNAGKQAYRITHAIRSRIARLNTEGGLGDFPPTLAFQSVVDATVEAPVLVSGLLDPLPEGGHELVLFDINRFTNVEAILKRDPDSWLDGLLADAGRNFTVSVVMNPSEEVRGVVVRQRAPGSDRFSEEPLPLMWPHDVYSLSHIALPFRPDDPLYGGPDAGPSPGIQLGNLTLRGERGILEISPTDMLRLRWNPFYAYLEERTAGAVEGLTAGAAPPQAAGSAP